MTSNPASRNARATTFAPRSWPSSPGLATTTRIFRSGIIALASTAGAPAPVRSAARQSSYRGADALAGRGDLGAIPGHQRPVEALAIVREPRDEVQVEVR